MHLFHHDVITAVLASGSRGNCTYIGDGRRGLVVDCGISTRQIRRRLDAVGLGDPPLDAALLTHEHADHVGAARILDRDVKKRTGEALPIYMTRGTRFGLHESVVPSRRIQVRAGEAFSVRGMRVDPFAVPHDTREPVGYAVDLGSARVGVFTDLGRVTRLVEATLASLDVAVVEFNHDLDMLLDGPYPWSLKQRVKGAHGHLSNEQAGDLLAHAAARAPRLRHVVLAHLSEENNTPERARDAAEQALWRAGRRDVTVHVAQQDTPLSTIQVEAVAAPAPTRRRRDPAPRRRVPARPTAPADHQIGLFDALVG